MAERHTPGERALGTGKIEIPHQAGKNHQAGETLSLVLLISGENQNKEK
jgi:hypothetical protein